MSDEKITSPAMPAVDPWARVDRLASKVDANAKETAERYGRLEERSRISTEQCEKEYATIREQIGSGARALGGVESRVLTLESGHRSLSLSHNKVAEVAEQARKDSQQSVRDLEGIQIGLIEHMRKAEAANLARERAADTARASDHARRDEAQRQHEARFESLGDAVKRQAVGIATVGEGVTETRAYLDLFARRVLMAAIAIGVVIVACGGVVVVTVLASRTPDTVTPLSVTDGGVSK